MTAPDRLADISVTRAATLACMVREEGVATIGAFLDRLDRQALYGLAVAAAAMVPVDQSASDLLAWVTWDDCNWTPENVRACHAAHNRGLRDDLTVAGERVYQARRHQLRRAG